MRDPVEGDKNRLGRVLKEASHGVGSEGGNGKGRPPLFASFAETRSDTLGLVENLDTLLDAVEAENSTLNRRVSDLSNELGNREKVEKQLNERIKALERENAICADLREKIAFQQKELTAATDKVARLEARCDQLTATKNDLEAEVARLDDEIDSACALTKQLRSDVARLEKERDAKAERAQSLELEVNAGANRCRDLEANLKAAKAEQEQLQLELKLARQALVDIHTALECTQKRRGSASPLPLPGETQAEPKRAEAGAPKEAPSPETEQTRVG